MNSIRQVARQMFLQNCLYILPIVTLYHFLFFALFLLFFPFLTEKDKNKIKSWKRWFWSAKGVRSTCLLVEMENIYEMSLGYPNAILMSWSCLLKVYYNIFVWLKLQLSFKSDEWKTGNQKETHILFFLK